MTKTEFEKVKESLGDSVESVELLHDGSYIRVTFCSCAPKSEGGRCGRLRTHRVSMGRPLGDSTVEDFLSEVRDQYIEEE